MRKPVFPMALALSLIGFGVFAGRASADGQRTPTIEESLNTKNAQTPRISPDGKYVAYQVESANWEDNAFQTDIWIVVVATGDRYQLTHSKKSSSDPKWDPEGNRLAFVSDRDGKRQLYLISAIGGEATQLTKLDTGINSFDWSPDGKHIAYTAADADSKAKKDRDEKYGEFAVVEGDYTMAHLWEIDPPQAGVDKMPEPRRLTEGASFTVGGFYWAPDSQRIAFSGARDPDLGSSDTAAIYVLGVDDKSLKKVVDTKGPNVEPMWSPDGKRLVYQTSNAQEDFYYLNSVLAVIPAEGGTPTLLTEKFDENPGLLVWAPDGIYFSASQKTYQHLFRVDPATKSIERITGPDKFIASQVSFTADRKEIAFIGSDPAHLSEVYVSGISPFEPRRLTAMSDQLKEFKLATKEVIRWKSSDGTEIEGILTKPVDFDPSRKYPLLVVIHGGPTGVDRAVMSGDRYYPVQMFVAKGALVLQPNYRGSAGYGEKFRSLNVRNLGVGDYSDVISGVDYLIGQGFVDKDRVGSMGWSQGGYISAFITTFSDRFRAVSVGAGISDWTTYYVNTDIHPFTRQYLKSTPWDDPEIYKKTSPITYIKTAKTPTLIQHGELDRRVPIPNGYELYQALKDRGVPVRMIVYKGFGHPITKPKQLRAVMEHNYAWFSHWIWGEPDTTPAVMQ